MPAKKVPVPFFAGVEDGAGAITPVEDMVVVAALGNGIWG